MLLEALKYDDIQKKFTVDGGGTTKYDILANYFHSLGFNGSSMPDMEAAFLTDAGFTNGTLADRWSAFLADAGYTGRLSDALRRWARA